MAALWITIIFTIAVVGIFVLALWLLLIFKARRIESQISRKGR